LPVICYAGRSEPNFKKFNENVNDYQIYENMRPLKKGKWTHALVFAFYCQKLKIRRKF